MAFHVGQKVVCVDDVHVTFKTKHPALEKGRVYEIASFGKTTRGWPGVHLVDVINPFDDVAFYYWRFRPLTDRKSSVSFTMGADPESERYDNRRKQKERA